MSNSAPLSTSPPGSPGDPAPELVEAARTLSRERLRFAIPVTVICFGSFMLVTVLAGFTGILNTRVAGPVTLLVVLLAIAFPLVGVCAVLYTRRAAGWDRRTAEVVESARAAADRTGTERGGA